MIENRLASIATDLAEAVSRASKTKLRAACLAATEAAISSAKVRSAVVDRTLRQLRSGNVLRPEEKAAIDALAAQLDDEYLKLQGEAEETDAAATHYLKAFAKARAVSALSFAASNADDAPSEAIYEAAIAMAGDQEKIFGIIRAALK